MGEAIGRILPLAVRVALAHPFWRLTHLTEQVRERSDVAGGSGFRRGAEC